MVIDVKPLLKGDTDEIKISYDLMIDENLGDIAFPENIKVNGFIKDTAGYITLSLEADVPYKTECARCLKEIKGNKIITFNKTVTDKETLQDEDNDDYVILTDETLDVDEALIEQILLDFPSKHLCKEDCKGLCPKCGADLNISPCDCDTREQDPRFDILRELLKK